jgi:hypothetical protein
MRVPLILLLLTVVVSMGCAAAPTYVWWEGEAAEADNFTNAPFAPATLDHPEALSGGDWLNTGGPREGDEIAARWAVEVPAAATWHLYARKFWHHGPFRWRFDDGRWQKAQDLALIDNVELKKFICANWVKLGTADLAKGPHLFQVALLAGPGEDAVGAFDCFVLTRAPFVPSGKLKPGEKTGLAMDGYWAFEPDPDTFDDSPIDLRRLNDAVAGERGFLQRYKDCFLFPGDDEPTRFWGVNAGPNVVSMDKASVDYLARRLAKLGVNMVRIHSAIVDRRADDPTTVDLAYLDKLHYFVHAMKQQGIYTYLSIYFPLWVPVKPTYGLPGYENIEEDIPFTLLFFYPRMQEIYKAWVTTLLQTPNPYTGLALADDPAVGIFEIVNEDNYFFWTFSPGQRIPFECIEVLERRFGEWAALRCGSLADALKEWDYPVDRDSVEEGRAGLLGAWSMTGAGLSQIPGSRKRVSDQVRFLTEDLRAFYEDMMGWLRSDVGLKCAVVATNWTVADPALLGALDKYTNMACDVLDRHAYWGPPHETDRGYTVTAGDRYVDRCAMLHPDELSVREIQYDGYPHTVSEYAFPMPNRFRGDSVFLASVYGQMQGTDAFFFFALNGPTWDAQLGKSALMTPAVAAQFPAAALCYRRGDLAEGRTVVRQALDLADLYDLKGSGGAESQNIDNLRMGEVPEEGRGTATGVPDIDPLAYYVGRVARAFSGDAERKDLSRFIRRDRQTIMSLSGEAFWNYGDGYAVVSTPRTQGATGFIADGQPIELAHLDIDLQNDYGCVLATSLDGEPLKTSARVLVQVMTDDTNYGWQTRPAGDLNEIVSLGSPPINVRSIEGAVALKRPDAEGLRVTALDVNGCPLKRALRLSRAEGRIELQLEPDVFYYVFERR